MKVLNIKVRFKFLQKTVQLLFVLYGSAVSGCSAGVMLVFCWYSGVFHGILSFCHCFNVFHCSPGVPFSIVAGFVVCPSLCSVYLSVHFHSCCCMWRDRRLPSCQYGYFFYILSDFINTVKKHYTLVYHVRT